MADFSTQDSRQYAPRGPGYGHPANYQRDAAFQNIFGGAPPPGRSQTMPLHTSELSIDRSQSMTMQSSGAGAQRGPAPARNMGNSYDRVAMNGYNAGQPQVNGNGYPRPYP